MLQAIRFRKSGGFFCSVFIIFVFLAYFPYIRSYSQLRHEGGNDMKKELSLEEAREALHEAFVVLSCFCILKFLIISHQRISFRFLWYAEKLQNFSRETRREKRIKAEKKKKKKRKGKWRRRKERRIKRKEEDQRRKSKCNPANTQFNPWNPNRNQRSLQHESRFEKINEKIEIKNERRNENKRWKLRKQC